MNTEYNGWTNRETWCIQVHCNPETKEDVEGIREILEEDIDRLYEFLQSNNMLLVLDLLDIDTRNINWNELKAELPSETEVESE